MEPLDLEAEIAAAAKVYASLDQETRRLRLEELKPELLEKAAAVKRLMIEKDGVEGDLKEIKAKINELTNEIRRKWGPFVEGADKAIFTLGPGVALEAKSETSIRIDDGEGDEDKAIKWLQSNGYDGVCKWQVHNQTLKSIASKEFANDVMIPGLRYTPFQIVKVK